MHSPQLSDFLTHAATSGIVPVWREIIADLHTPLTVFAALGTDKSHAFLFESLEGGEKWGRYSFIGLDPLVTFESAADRIIIHDGREINEVQGDPIQAMRDLFARLNPCRAEGLPRFYGGAVGYLGYDMVRFMEHLPASGPSLDLPDSSFMVPATVLIYDNLRQTILLVKNVRIRRETDVKQAYDTALTQLDELAATLTSPLDAADFLVPGLFPEHTFTSNMERQQFCDMVERAKAYIIDGDIIQVVLSQRFHTETDIPPLTLYRALRHINPSPYLFYLKLGDVVQIGSSPEILVRLEKNEITLRPIAGTRPRGKTDEEDQKLARELLADPKERAEHLMLVDLGRNDVGRVAQAGSVKTRDLLVIERYSHVMHIVSGVHGLLKPELDQFDVLCACFPAGTVSGAPKIRAMEIIDELEPGQRGPYAGSVGYFGFSGSMDFCITIRTMVLCGRDLWIQAGAGIVADSDPEKEYEETINKAKGLRRAITLAEQGLGRVYGQPATSGTGSPPSETCTR